MHQPTSEYWQRLALGDSGNMVEELALLAEMEKLFNAFVTRRVNASLATIRLLGEIEQAAGLWLAPDETSPQG